METISSRNWTQVANSISFWDKCPDCFGLSLLFFLQYFDWSILRQSSGEHIILLIFQLAVSFSLDFLLTRFNVSVAVMKHLLESFFFLSFRLLWFIICNCKLTPEKVIFFSHVSVLLWSTPSLSLLLNPLWPGVVVPVRVPSRGLICLKIIHIW